TPRPWATALAPATPAHRQPRTCDWTCALSSDICFSRRLSPFKGFSTRTLSEFGREPLLLFLNFQLNVGHPRPKGLSASFLTHRLTESSILKALIVARENPKRNCLK